MKFNRAICSGAAVLLAFAACGDDDSTKSFAIADECNPLSAVACAVPWPSGVYLAEDSTTATGMRLDIAKGALPTNADASEIDPAMQINGLAGD